MIYLIIILILIILSHIIAKLKLFVEDPYYNNAYYYFYKNKYIPDYTGICFYTITNGIKFLDIQTGYDGFDRCITICNISFILGKSSKYE